MSDHLAADTFDLELVSDGTRGAAVPDPPPSVLSNQRHVVFD